MNEPWNNKLCIYTYHTRAGDLYSYTTRLRFTNKRIDKIIKPLTVKPRVRQVKDVDFMRLLFVKMAFGIRSQNYGGVLYPNGGEPDDFYDKRP